MSGVEKNGAYGQAYGQFEGARGNFDVSLCEAPCSEPCCCCCGTICLCPGIMYMRYSALNHVHPGSGWSRYKCCQGYFGGCCCLQPGAMCEETCPCPCACLESFCCPGAAASTNGMILRERYGLGLDECDIRLIQCNNCLQCFACICSIVACCTDNEAIDDLSRIIDCIANCFFCSLAGCMTAQTHHEIKKQERTSSAPQRQRIRR